MSAVADLIISLVAKDMASPQLDAVRRASAKMGTTAGEAGGKVSGLSGAFSALGGVLSGISLAGAATSIYRMANAMDDLADNADALGFSTTRLQALQISAEKAGVGFDVLAGASVKMQRTIWEAMEGNADAQRTLDRLGLSAVELAGKTPEGAFLDLARAISGIQNPMQRTALEMEIFGKSGAKLRLVLNEAGEAADKFKDQIVSEGTVRRLGDAADRFDSWWRETKRDAAEAAGQYLLFGDAIDRIRTPGFRLPTPGVEGAASFDDMARVGSAARDLASAVWHGASGMREMMSAAEKTTSWYRRHVELQNQAVGHMERASGLMKQFQDATARATPGFDEKTAQIQEWVQKARESGVSEENIAWMQKGLEQAAERARRAEEKMEAGAKAREIAERVQTPEEKYNVERAQLTKLHGTGALSDELFARAIAKLNQGEGPVGLATRAYDLGGPAPPISERGAPEPFAPAAEKGSAEAWSSIMASMRESQGGGREDSAVQRDQLRQLEIIAGAVGGVGRTPSEAVNIEDLGG